MPEADITVLDPRMTSMPARREGLEWHLPFEPPMRLVGLAWFNRDHAYERLPLARPATVTNFPDGKPQSTPAEQCGAFILSRHTAGAQVRFRTDSSRVVVDVEETNATLMRHFAATGSMGMDLYTRGEEGDWHCVGVTMRDPAQMAFAAELADGMSRRMRDVIIHLPTYAGLVRLAIGLDEGARLEEATPFAAAAPVVWYGTSITQGGCATRPGLAATNILSRLLDREVLNLGFSGSGRGEPEVIAILASIPNPALYILDYCWNASPAELTATLPGAIDTLQQAHPGVPILLLTPTPGRGYLEDMPTDIPRRAQIMEEEARRRRADGDRSIFFFDTGDALGKDFWEGYVDGCHLNDIGFYRLAHGLHPVVKAILGTP